MSGEATVALVALNISIAALFIAITGHVFVGAPSLIAAAVVAILGMMSR